MSDGAVYALRLPCGHIKFGWTTMLYERATTLRRRYGPDTEFLGYALAKWGDEQELLQLLRPFAVDREVFKPAPVVLRAVSMMTGRLDLPPPSPEQLRPRSRSGLPLEYGVAA